MRRLLLPLVGVLTTLALSTGCGEDFPPYGRITTFRVLAIAADPPTPAPGETTKLTTLLYQPGVGFGENLPGVTYKWSWCPFAGSADGGYQCQVTQAQLDMLGGGVPLPALELGAGPTAELTHAISPAILAQVCAGAPGGPRVFDCAGGFPIQIKLTVSTATETITAVSQVRLRYEASMTPNQRPYIEGLAAEIAGVDVPIGVEPAATLLRDKENVIKAQVSESTSESYLGVDDDLRPKMVRERLTFSWFVETGDLDEETTAWIEGGYGSLMKNLRNKWIPQTSKDFTPTQARLMVVVRDTRGGVGWRDGLVNLSEKP